MQFFSGRTRCKLCSKPLFTGDDFVAVPILENPPPDRVGFYHRACFNQLPDRERLTAAWAATTRDLVTKSGARRVIASSDRFLVVATPADHSLTLYLLKAHDEIRFPGPDAWLAFRDLVASEPVTSMLAGSGPEEASSSDGRFELAVTPNGAAFLLRWTAPIPREVDFPADEYDRYAQEHGPLNGFVDLVELGREHGLTPSFIDGAPEQNSGTVTDVRRVKDVVIVSLVAESPRKALLPPGDLRDLRKVVSDVR